MIIILPFAIAQTQSSDRSQDRRIQWSWSIICLAALNLGWLFLRDSTESLHLRQGEIHQRDGWGPLWEDMDQAIAEQIFQAPWFQKLPVCKMSSFSDSDMSFAISTKMKSQGMMQPRNIYRQTTTHNDRLQAKKSSHEIFWCFI